MKTCRSESVDEIVIGVIQNKEDVYVHNTTGMMKIMLFVYDGYR